MLSLHQDSERYEKALKTFKDYSEEYEVYKQWYETKFEQLVADKIKLEKGGQQELRVMGVGSGSGEADYEMLKRLLSRHPNISNVVIEPADQMMHKYRHLVTSRQQSLSGVVFDWRQQKYEDYQRDCQQADVTKFNFIHVIHSLYRMSDLDAVLESLWERLDNGGVLLIIITSETSGLHHVHEKFDEKIEGINRPTKRFKSSDVLKVFDKLGLTYKVHPQPLRLDITKCFQDGDPDGDLILDFMNYAINFRDVLPKTLVEDYLQFLKDPQCSEVCGDKVLLNMDWNAILVYKE
ncbi:histamine N-methyltransferase-like [Amphiura filiformis]|uniref:histamine N-methyltransferase-like n=1 Tax=Amphiura filiformis TaxID=82378 RepID=UPI003B2283DE